MEEKLLEPKDKFIEAYKSNVQFESKIPSLGFHSI